MADWNDLKRAFEKDIAQKEEQNKMDEQSLLETIAKYLGGNKGISALMGYDTKEMLNFLSKPSKEIKKEIGGEWATLDDSQFEILVYSLSKKVKKSDDLLHRSGK